MSARHALLIDFGSTYTKLRAVDLDSGRLTGGGQGPSTVTDDINIGFEAALADLEAGMGGLPDFEHRLASSSAAGGLRMVTVGLVRQLTAEAARQAALGAGARLVGSYAYRLIDEDVREIEDHGPDILLLAGGADGGNVAVIEHNARALADSALACPVVVAGNRVAGDSVRATLGERAIVTENVMPDHGVLNIGPARAAIREIFLDRIVHARGIDRAEAGLDAILMPTPAAVLAGARLLADGPDEGGPGETPGLGALLLVDVGGATTDVHSIGDGAPTGGAMQRGLPEPYDKRTVEGDLGMRHNVLPLAGEVGLEALAAEAGLPVAEIETIVGLFADDVERLPESRAEAAVDEALAGAAVRLAVSRHAGTLETVYTGAGPAMIQHGKDLGALGTVIGTGGVLAHGGGGALAAALADPADSLSLRPRNPRLMLDRDYILFACGLLGTVDPLAAYKLGIASLEELPGKSDDRHSVA